MSFWKKKSEVREKTIRSRIQKSSIPPKAKTSSIVIPKYVPKEIHKPKEKAPTKPKPEGSQKPKLEQRQDPEKEFLRVFKQLTYRYRPWDIWKDFVTMFACAISNAVDESHYDEREALYMKTIKKYNKEEQMLFPELVAHTTMALEYNPEQDFLGHIFMMLELGDSGKAQIFTPYHVCQLMAEITIGNIQSEVMEKGYITIFDPCCGAGATLIAGINESRKQLEKVGLNFQNHVLVAAQDIDETVAFMCYIQLSLLGMAAYIKSGNSLTEPMCSNDSLEHYWFTPIYFSDVWVMRRLFQVLKL